MTDPRSALQRMFNETNRHANFGDLLIRIHVRGFRCHANTVIEVKNPITAFCGLNGTGKSTLLQLAATAYKNPIPGRKPYYVKDFLVVGTLDPAPFTKDASAEFTYAQADRSIKSVTLSRNAQTKRWQGYQSRPQRRVLFAGAGLYLPKVEQRDFVIHKASRLKVSGQSVAPAHVKEWICRVLSQAYEHVHLNTVKFSNLTSNVATVKRSGSTYSETHMGYGEGRTQYLINTIETLPDQSLVLIEEPETSLHASAQYEFGRYLVDVAKRKRHQILLTTHSDSLLKALPSQSRFYLNRTNKGIEPIIGLTAGEARSLMAQGHEKALHILVEDDCAEAILSELIRRVDMNFLQSVGVYPVGGAETIATTMRTLSTTGLPVAAVRDGDRGDAPSNNLFKLPGAHPPERVLFSSSSVKEHVRRTYRVDLDDFSASLAGEDHHRWFDLLGAHVSQNRTAIVSEAARAYVSGLSEAEVVALIEPLKEAAQR